MALPYTIRPLLFYCVLYAKYEKTPLTKQLVIHDGVGIALLIIVAAQTLIERRDKGFVFLGQWILLSCGSLIILVTPSISRTKRASFRNCFGNFPKENLRSDPFSCIMGFEGGEQVIPEDDWYGMKAEEEVAVDAMLTMPLYDEDGNEIPEEELPWNNIPDERIVDDDSEDWSADDEPEESLPPSKPDKRRRNADKVRSSAELRKRIAQSVREEALRRLELSARTLSEFQELVDWYDREEESRMRRERRYETLRGDIPLESGALPGGHILPHSMRQSTFRQICRGEFDDYLNTCLFMMHDLTERAHLREIVMNLKLDHKEILFFLGIRLYTTHKLAELRGQTERNIRKVRDTVQRRIHRKLYTALTVLQQNGDELIHLEQDFLRDYTPPKRRHSSDDEPV